MPSGKPLFHLIGQASSEFAKWSKDGFKKINQNDLSERMKICKSCEFWDSSGFAETGKCTQCGCSTQAKLRMSTSKCPIDKWGAIEVESPQ